jgi:hypothetical protein
MLPQLNLFTLPTAISIACFDAVFFVAADLFGMTAREIVLGVIAGGVSGLSVLVAVLWRSARKENVESIAGVSQ